MVSKADIIARLQREILPLQGYKPQPQRGTDKSLGPITEAFPNKEFPIGAIHEFQFREKEEAVATGGFIAGIISSFIKKEGVTVWICKEQNIFPPALAFFGLKPEQFIFIYLEKEKDRLWVMEEALKCPGITAVIGECKMLNFTISRRFQLAVEKSGVTGFIIREEGKNTTASLTKWRIHSLPSYIDENLPGIGFPFWDVNLEKVRHGKPGSWELLWRKGCFQTIEKQTKTISIQHRKTG